MAASFHVGWEVCFGQNEYPISVKRPAHTTRWATSPSDVTAATFEGAVLNIPNSNEVTRGDGEASRLSEHLFSGFRAVTPETQDLGGKVFAVPLGLVRGSTGPHHIPLTQSGVAEIHHRR